jgi:hypothetical protein
MVVSTPLETLAPTGTSEPPETPVSPDIQPQAPEVVGLPAINLSDESTLLIVGVCGGGLLVLFLFFVVGYLIRRILNKRSKAETPVDPNAVVPEPSDAEAMAW